MGLFRGQYYYTLERAPTVVANEHFGRSDHFQEAAFDWADANAMPAAQFLVER